jgi:hypothetical protein
MNENDRLVQFAREQMDRMLARIRTGVTRRRRQPNSPTGADGPGTRAWGFAAYAD